jgi:hypothetical protein
VLKNTSDTVTATSRVTGFSTGSNSYASSLLKGFLVPTNGGNILSSWGNAATNDTQLVSISGDTLTAHTAFNAGSLGGDSRTQWIFRRPGTNVYNVLNDGKNHGYKMTLTENGNSSSAAIGADITLGSNSDFFYGNPGIPGHVDANTMHVIKSADGDSIQPTKMEFDSTGAQSLSLFSGSPSSNNDIEDSDNYIAWPQGMDPPYYTTDFNDTSIFIARGGGGSNTAKVQVHAYKAGESSFNKSDILSVSAGTITDTHVTGCFVGADNDVFLFSMVQVATDALVVFKYIYSTNTLSEVFRIAKGSDWNIEETRISRWGDDRAVLFYDDDKIRLLTA